MAGKVTGYSTVQIALHWIIVFLVAFQFVAHDDMEESWRAFRSGEAAPANAATLTNFHVAIGVMVLLLMLARAYIRLTRGAPAPPTDESKLLQLAAEGVHYLIYALLLALPLTGLSAWFLGVGQAGSIHSLLTNVLLAAIALHVAGAVFQHFVRRSDVLLRIFRPES